MKIGIDCGNSSIKCYLFNENGFAEQKIFQSGNNDFIKALKKGLIKSAESVIISSVVRNTEILIQKFCKKHNVPFFSISSEKIPGIVIDYKTPETLGADRILNCAAANNQFPGENTIIIDAGTAVTIDILSEKNVFQGGMIFPGQGTAAESLSKKTDALPLISWQNNSPLIGKNTVECISSGIFNGWPYIIKGLCDAVESQNGTVYKKIITGGYTQILRKSHVMENFIFINNFQIYGFIQIDKWLNGIY